MERTYRYRGDLRATALPEMLFTIYRTRMAGVIEAQRGSVVKQVWIQEGEVVQATSTDRNDSLGAYLRRSGRINQEQFVAAMRQREASQKRLGEVLIERGLLSPAEVYRAIREQIESVVWSLFAWEEGEVAFSIGDAEPPGAVRILIPMRQMILQGIRRAPNARALIARLGRKETLFEASYRSEDLVEMALEAQEFELLKMINGRRSLYEICTGGPFSPGENGKLVYAFSVLQLIRRLEEQEVGIIKIRMKAE